MGSRSTDEMLARVPLFEGLSKKDLAEVSNLATRLTLPAGRELTKQGAFGQEFIIVLEGSVDVIIDGDVVASPEAGQCYGEVALLDDRPRMATVVARTDVVVDVIGRRDFADMLVGRPQIAERLHDAMVEHLASDPHAADDR